MSQHRPDWWPKDAKGEPRTLQDLADAVHGAVTGQTDMDYLSVGDYVRALEHAVSEWRAGTHASQFYDGAVKTLATAACWEWTDWCRAQLPAHYAGTIGDPKMYEASAPGDAAKAGEATNA